jgi:hypothetical protein
MWLCTAGTMLRVTEPEPRRMPLAGNEALPTAVYPESSMIQRCAVVSGILPETLNCE